jgi:hypothetical protein
VRSLLHRATRLLLKERTRRRLNTRLHEKTRNSETFTKFNHYLILRLTRS